jgi:actin-like ATPase involved in cell morphogenesis
MESVDRADTITGSDEDTDPSMSIRKILGDALQLLENEVAECPSFRDIFPALAEAVEGMIRTLHIALESNEPDMMAEVEKIRQAARYTLSKADELERVIQSSTPIPITIDDGPRKERKRR